jgi:hypothetical protein
MVDVMVHSIIGERAFECRDPRVARNPPQVYDEEWLK